MLIQDQRRRRVIRALTLTDRFITIWIMIRMSIGTESIVVVFLKYC